MKVCTTCAKVAWSRVKDQVDQVWIEPEDNYRGGGDNQTEVAHGCCRLCYDRLVAEFA